MITHLLVSSLHHRPTLCLPAAHPQTQKLCPAMTESSEHPQGLLKDLHRYALQLQLNHQQHKTAEDASLHRTPTTDPLNSRRKWRSPAKLLRTLRKEGCSRPQCETMQQVGEADRTEPYSQHQPRVCKSGEWFNARQVELRPSFQGDKTQTQLGVSMSERTAWLWERLFPPFFSRQISRVHTVSWTYTGHHNICLGYCSGNRSLYTDALFAPQLSNSHRLHS